MGKEIATWERQEYVCVCVCIYKYIQEKKRRRSYGFQEERKKRGAEGPGVVWAAAEKNIKILKEKRESHLVG